MNALGTIALAAAFALAAAGCSKDAASDAPPETATDAGADGALDAGADGAGDAASDGDADAGPPAPNGTLSIDIRGQVDVTWSKGAGDALATHLAIMSNDGLADILAVGELDLTGRVERFPEAPIVLYTGHADAPALAGGPCGTGARSLVLSLVRREDNERVAGALTLYCGAGAQAGRPARILRLSGKLPPPL